MATPFLSDTEHFGNKISNSLLEAAKFSELTTTPEPGHFYKKDGVLYYRNDSNVEIPVHENALRTITAAAGSPITTAITGTEVEIAIAQATDTTPGTLSPELFALLSGATVANTPGTVVLRGDGGSGGSTDLDYLRVVDLSVSNNIIASYVGAQDISGQEIVAFNLSINGLITAPEVTGLSATPTGNSSATSKLYVDAQIQEVLTASLRSQDFKTESVRVALDTNLPLESGAGTYDGIAFSLNDSILLLNQNDPAQNGAYTVTTGGLVRRADSNSNANLTPGATYTVEAGTYAQHFFTLAAPSGFVLDTDPINFVDVAGVNTVIAGDGLTKTGQIINVVGTPGQITVTGDSVAISSDYIGQPSITTVGTVSSGVWDATEISVANGGTGATEASTALTNLGAQHEISFICGDNQATEFPLFHGLNNSNPTVTGIYNGVSLGAVDFTVTNSNQVNIRASLGGAPIGTSNLVITVKARTGGSENTITVGDGGS